MRMHAAGSFKWDLASPCFCNLPQKDPEEVSAYVLNRSNSRGFLGPNRI